MLSVFGYAGLRAAGVPALARRLHPGAAILAYHNVVRAGHTFPVGDAGAHLDADRFADQMEWVATRFTVIPLSELAERVKKGLPLRGVLALTFDDGYLGTLKHAVPILRDLGLPATLFVVGDAPATGAAFWWDHPEILRTLDGAAREHYLTTCRGDRRAILGMHPDPAYGLFPSTFRPAAWSELAEVIGDGIEVGAHSMCHRALTQLTDLELAVDLDRCREAVIAHLGVPPTLFAYPYGHWDARVRHAVTCAGFTAAVTLDGGTNRDGADPWSLTRINIPAQITPAAFACWTAGIHPLYRVP